MSNKTDRELLLDALNALYQSVDFRQDPSEELMDEIRARLAEPEDEPVAWASTYGRVYVSYIVASHSSHGKEPIPLYRHPRQPA